MSVMDTELALGSSVSRWAAGCTPGGLAGEQAVLTNVAPFGVRGAQLLGENDHLSVAPGAKGKQDEITSIS